MFDDHREVHIIIVIIIHDGNPTFYNHYHVMMLSGTHFLEQCARQLQAKTSETSSGMFKDMPIRLNQLGLAQQNLNGL